MKNQRNKSNTIASILALIMVAAMLMAFTPNTFGQIEVADKRITMSAANGLRVLPTVVGLGQTVDIVGLAYPAPPYTISLDFTITKPDGTTETRKEVGDANAEVRIYNYMCNQLGTWSVRFSFPGDDQYTDVTSSLVSWTVQAEQVTKPAMITMDGKVSTVPVELVGRGQSVYIVGWLNPPRHAYGFFSDVKLTVTKPNGQTDSILRTTDASATVYWSYVMDQVGTWSVQLSWPGDWIRTSATSPIHTWTVQEEAVPYDPQQPLPDYPWKFPIQGQYQEWYQISGAWPQHWYDSSGSNFNPYSTAPTTPHVLWTYQWDDTGLIGGDSGYSSSYISGRPMIAAMGRLYYTLNERYITSEGLGDQHPVLYCLNQLTGELIYKADLPGTGTGTTIGFDISSRLKIDPKTSEPEPGKFSIWVSGGGLWEVDPFTGNTLYYLPGVSAQTVYGGLAYYNGHLFLANYPSSGQTSSFDTVSREIEWTKSGISFGQMLDVDLGIIATVTRPTGGYPTMAYIRTWDANTGELIANGDQTGDYLPEYNPQRWAHGAYNGITIGGTSDGYMHGVSLTTGKVVWTSSEPSILPWGAFFTYTGAHAYGNFYQASWDGYMRAYDATSGVVVWKTFLDNNQETAMGHNVAWGQPVIADGKIYFSTGEHTPPTPYPRGNKLYCLDAYTGELIWKMPIMERGRLGAISAGILMQHNAYDGLYYAFGKGPSETTVSIQQNVVAKGSSTLIMGTVTDQSAGAKGTPAVSDGSMGAWMEYLYMNAPEPADATGVQVALVAVASDGNVIDIGHATSTSSGEFSLLWTPPAEGTYRIIASFDGSGSYYSSWGETSLGVTAAPSPGGPIEPEPTAGLGITEIAIIAAVVVAVIVGIVAFWALKKRE